MLDDKWKKRFIQLSKEISTWSKDPSTKVGALIISEDRNIVSTGYNGFPRGIEDTEERLNNRELKYKFSHRGSLKTPRVASFMGA